MTFSLCRRCRTNSFDLKNDYCHGCQHAANAGESTLPIPSWVVEQLEFRSWELREIRDVNLGLKPIRIPLDGPADKGKLGTITELPQRRNQRWRRSRRDFFPIIERGVVEI